MKAGDFTAAWGGIAGCQSLLSLLLDADRLPLGQVAALTSANVAARFNLPKGRLEPGADADLVLVDLRITAGPLAGNHFLTVTEGADRLRELGRLVLWEGAQDVVFENS